jgi:hypothetical protein
VTAEVDRERRFPDAAVAVKHHVGSLGDDRALVAAEQRVGPGLVNVRELAERDDPDLLDAEGRRVRGIFALVCTGVRVVQRIEAGDDAV